MAKQETLTLFPEVEVVTKKMTNAQFGELMRAVMAYRWRGETYSGSDAAIDIAFQFLSNQVDRGEAAKAAKSKAAKERWEKKVDAEPMQNDADVCKGVQNDAPILSSPILSSPILSSPLESKADKPPAPAKQARKSFGEFGWVKLTDEEYSRLLNDLGEAEVKRCITYVDESAQSTGNKNKWRDWNLVVKKCHKQGWGLGQGASKPNFPKRNEIPKGASGELGEAELEAIRQLFTDEEWAERHKQHYGEGGSKNAGTP